jgi:aminoglycoside 6'-N-acetyltransferase I
METVIRRACPDDRAKWAELRRQLWPLCPDSRHRLEIDQLLKNGALVVVASAGGELVGFAEVSIRVDHVEGTANSPIPYLEGWYVAEAHRRRGIGRAILVFVERWAMERGFREIASDAEVANEAAIGLHARLGFAEVGRTVHFVKTLGATIRGRH